VVKLTLRAPLAPPVSRRRYLGTSGFSLRHGTNVFFGDGPVALIPARGLEAVIATGKAVRAK